MTHKRAAMSNSTISLKTSTSQFLIEPPMMRSLLLLLLCSPLTRTKPRGWCASDVDCPATDPVCSEWGFCQCASYQPGGADCWGQGGGGGGGGACGSDADCPATDPVCSEWGFCQCAEYQPGDPECYTGAP